MIRKDPSGLKFSESKQVLTQGTYIFHFNRITYILKIKQVFKCFVGSGPDGGCMIAYYLNGTFTTVTCI